MNDTTKRAPRTIPPGMLVASRMRSRLQRTALIRATVAEYFGITEEQMVSRSNKVVIAWPRQVAIHFVKQFTVYQMREIITEFGRKNHASVLSSINVVQDRCDAYPLIKDDLSKLEKLIQEKLKEIETR